MKNFSDQILLNIDLNNQKELNDLYLNNKPKFRSTIYSLKKRRFVIEDKNKKLGLLSKGLIKVQRIKWTLVKGQKKNSHKGILVLFDIPEENRKMRDLFRRCLYELGFERIQRSVFLCNYDVSKEIKELVKNCELQDCVKHLYVVGGKV